MGEEWRRRGGRLLVVGAFLVSAYYLVWGGEYSIFDIRELETARHEARERVDLLQERVDSVAVWADSLIADTLAIERVARERYGFLREGERLYRFVEVSPLDQGLSEVDRGNLAD